MVLVKRRCVLTFLTLGQVLIHTQSINIIAICETAFITLQYFNSTSSTQQQIIRFTTKKGASS